LSGAFIYKNQISESAELFVTPAKQTILKSLDVEHYKKERVHIFIDSD
jgi:hypothetical protein